MQTNRFGNVVGTFPEKLAAAEKAVSELWSARARGDANGISVAARRLRYAIDLVERVAIAAGIDQTDQHQAISAELRKFQAIAYALLEEVHADGPVLVRRHLSRVSTRNPLDQFRRADGVIVASYQTIREVTLANGDLRRARFVGAMLSDVQFHSTVLAEIDAEGAVLARVDAIGATMHSGNLRSCLVEASNFSRANLERTDWHDASVFDSRFPGAAMADTLLAEAMFVDCDFRGTDLRIVSFRKRASMVGARFVRCDLRESSWNGRVLGGATFIDCRMHGIVGQLDATGAEIVRPDLSALGDGSVIGSASEVIAAWQRA